MRLSERQARLVQLLAQSQGPITGSQLASTLGVSVRTVQSEVAKANQASKEPLVRSTNRGYELTQGGWEALAMAQAPASPAADASPARSIALRLALERHPLTSRELASSLCMGTSTLERQLPATRQLLAGYDLRLDRRGGALTVVGSQADLQRMVARLMRDEVGDALMPEQAFSTYFDGFDLDELSRLLNDLLNKHHQHLRPGYERGTWINVCICLYWISRGAHVPAGKMGTGSEGTGEKDVAHAMARELCEHYSRRGGTQATESDVESLALMLQGQLVPDEPSQSSPLALDPQLLRQVRSCVASTLAQFQIPMANGRSVYNFAQHVEGLMRRPPNMPVADTGLLASIQRESPFVYEASVVLASKLSERLGLVISSDELAFVCVHMGLIIMESTADQREDTVRVGVLEQGHPLVMERIVSQLSTRLPDYAVVSIYPHLHDIVDASDRVDVLVSVGAVHLPATVCVSVSPLFGPDDMERVWEAVRTCSQARAQQRRQWLQDYFDKDLFVYDEKGTVRTPQDAIGLLAGMLERRGIVGPSFLGSVLERERLGSTSFFDLFAIPHSTQMDAQQTVLAVLVSPGGIVWPNGAGSASPIHVVVMIAVNADDRKRFMSMFDTLVGVLSSEARVRELARCRTLEEFLQVVGRG